MDRLNSAQCFFIFGCSRSGTSLLSKMLDSHPALTVPFESHLYKMFWKHRHYYGDLENKENQKTLIKDILATRIFSYWSPTPVFNQVVSNLQHGGFSGVMDAIMRSSAPDKAIQLWGEKTPGHVRYWQEIKSCFPDCKVIYIVRDGRDVASSLVAARFGPVTLEAAARYWVNHLKEIEPVKNNCDPDNFILIKYEDLLSNPESTLKTICNHLSIAYDHQMLEFHNKKADYPTDITNITNLQSPLLKSNSVKWPEKLTSNEIGEIESIAGETLKAYDYPLSKKSTSQQRPKSIAALKRNLTSPLLRFFSRAGDIQGQKEFINLRLIRAKRIGAYYTKRIFYK